MGRQLQIDLPLEKTKPLWPLEAVMCCLQCNEDTVLSHIDRGFLRFAFDIAHPDATRREIRVYRGSLIDYAAEQHLTPEYFKQDDAALMKQVVIDILGADPLPRANFLADRFTCGGSHIYNLVRAGQLTTVDAIWRRGHDGSARITRQSAEHFLLTRRTI